MVDKNENILVEFDYNNIIIVDPNKIIDENGVAKQRLVQHENLVMYANLETRVLPRTKLAEGVANNDKIETVSIASINFLKPGGKTFLDTSWTDEITGKGTTTGEGVNQPKQTSIKNPNRDNDFYIRQTIQSGGKPGSVDNGLLGITNINIRQNTSFMPTISIELVDIKGRALFESGDNSPYAAFFNLQLTIDESNQDCVFRWKARNHVNGLMYGNGGISCWTKSFVQNMRTHEASDGSPSTAVEFCFEPNYWAMHDCYSTTYPNQSPFQAWRAGFREGVKMCLDRGVKPDITEFKERLQGRNLDRLTIWHAVGLDVDQGAWAIAGAKQGTLMTMLSDWDYTKVQDFSELEHLWKSQVSMRDPLEIIDHVSQTLAHELDLPGLVLNINASKFFKHHYRSNFENKGIMIRDQ